jgi:hypothetical protein
VWGTSDAFSGTSPATITGNQVSRAFDQAAINSVRALFYADYLGFAYTWNLYEAFLDVVYANPPTAALTAPTASQVITTTSFPTISWTHTPGTDGDAQAAYHLYVAQLTGGPGSGIASTVWDSGEVTSNTSSVVCGVSLPNSLSYRAIIRTAQLVNGVLQWATADATVDFTMTLSVPATPTLSATLQAASGRVQLVMATSTSVTALSYFEAQASTDAGTTWRAVRGDMTGVSGRILASSNSLTRHDYEIEVNKATAYRVRVVSTLGIVSAWSTTTSTVTWTPTALWIKSPLAPALNVSTLRMQSAPDWRRSGRSTAFYPAGRRNAVVISDARAGYVGSIGVLTTSAADRALLTALLDRQETLLVQGPAAWEMDLYAQPIDTTQARVTRLVAQADRYEDVPLAQTDRPSVLLPVASWPA